MKQQNLPLLLKIVLAGMAAGLLGAGIRLLDQLVLLRRLAFSTYAFVIGLAFLAIGFFVARHVFRRSQERAIEQYADAGSVDSGGALTKREEEVLLLIAHGKTNQQIAEALFISLSTVKTHIANIYSKLGVSRRTQALARARADGILQS